MLRMKIQDGWQGARRKPDSAAKGIFRLAWIFLLVLMPVRLNGAELKQKTARAFNQYVKKAELRMKQELKPGGNFLWIDTLPGADRAAAYARLRNGDIIVHPVAAGRDIPGGMIHDWIAIAFIPHVTLDETLAQIQDYNAYPRIYSPEVARSKTLERAGNNFKVSLWLEKKSIVTVVLDVVENVEYLRLDSSHAYSCAHSTRIVLVRDSGTSQRADHRSASEQGYLWNLNGYGWFLQTPVGVYVQLEAVALSRNIPWGLEWLIKPFLSMIPRDTLQFTLAHARASLEQAAGRTTEVNGAKPSGLEAEEGAAKRHETYQDIE